MSKVKAQDCQAMLTYCCFKNFNALNDPFCFGDFFAQKSSCIAKNDDG